MDWNGTTRGLLYSLLCALLTACAADTVPSSPPSSKPSTPPSPSRPPAPGFSAPSFTPPAFSLPPKAGTTKDYLRSFYVDYEAGDDSNPGTTPQAPFKHSPGDPQAQGIARSIALEPGDRVVFKGGVEYRGTVVIDKSGTEEHPIILDGNWDGTFGSGRAIVTGTELLNGITACGQANEHAIFCAPLPPPPEKIDTPVVHLFQDGSRLTPAQHPTPSDFYRVDNLTEFREVPVVKHQDKIDDLRVGTASVAPKGCTADKLGYIEDPDFFGELAGNWDSSEIIIWHVPNTTTLTSICAYDAASGRIYFPAVNFYSDRPTKYAILNHPAALDTAGEYLIDKANNQVRFIPLQKDDSPNVTIATREIGIRVEANYVTVRGFRVEGHVGQPGATHSGAGIRARRASTSDQDAWYRGIRIYDNELQHNSAQANNGAIYLTNVRDTLVYRNHVHHNQPNRGIFVSNARDIVVVGNTVHRSGGTGIAFFRVTDGLIAGNRITGVDAVHANGITLYLQSKRNYVCDNDVSGGNVAMTTKSAEDIVIAFNRLHTAVDAWTYADWQDNSAPSKGLMLLNNLILSDLSKAVYIPESSHQGLAVVNNILDGLSAVSESSIRKNRVTISHNVYTKLVWNQKDNYGWSLGPGEHVVEGQEAVLQAGANGRYQPTALGRQLLNHGEKISLSSQCYKGNISFIGPFAP